MKILILGHKMQSEPGFRLFEELGHQYIFINSGNTTGVKNNLVFDAKRPAEQLKSTVHDFKADIVYFYADAGHPIYAKHAFEIFSQKYPVPFVFGFHNHLMRHGNREELVLKNTDGHVFLNSGSQQFYQKMYDIQQPHLIVPCLYLPPYSHYRNALKLEKLSKQDSKIHIGLGGRIYLHQENPPIKDGYEMHNRCDFTRMIEQFDKHKNICLHLFGESIVFDQNKNKKTNCSAVKDYYTSLISEPNRLKTYGMLPRTEYEKTLSSLDYFISKGFLPGDRVSPYEHLNYQSRWNSAMTANIPFLIAEGTDNNLTNETNTHGGGITYRSINSLVETLENLPQKTKERLEPKKLRKVHCFDHWVTPLVKFFESVTHSIQPISVK